MHTKHLTLASGLTILVYVVLCLNGCGESRNGDSLSFLQAEIASRLADPDACPSGDSRDVQEAVDTAGQDGLVHLQEGCYLMKATVDLPPGIRLVGAGAERTILYRDPAGFYSQPILRVRGNITSERTQISGIAFVGVRKTEDIGQDYGIILTNLPNFRVDHSYFEGFGFAAVRVEGVSNGVIDHAIFVDNFKRAIDNLGYGVVVYGSGNWTGELAPGGAQATFVEDSIFSGNRHAIAASAGAHYVFRFNQVLHSVVACAVDAHGMGYGSAHGTRYVEIYNNVIENPIDNWCGIGIRGGAGVIFNNTIMGYENPILLILEWGTPDSLKTNYPAVDQVQELYIWDNQKRFTKVNPKVDETGIGFIEAGRDYFTEPKAGYEPFEYPHPLANGGEFDLLSWPPVVE